MNFKGILQLVIFGAVVASLPAQNAENTSNAEARLAAASDRLQAGANEIAIYTRGAICGSCGVGIRIILSKAEGVDKKKYQKGVYLDVEHQLAVLALKEGIEPDLDAIFQAVYDAGYDPVNYYRHNGDAVELFEHSFVPED